MKFRRKFQPPGIKHGPGYRRRHNDFALAMKLTGTMNSSPWRGRDARICLLTGVTIFDGLTTFDIEPGRDVKVLWPDGQIQTFQVYRALDFNQFDLGVPVLAA